MEKNINLAKILNGKPVNTKLWSPLFGDVYTSSIYSEDTIIVVNHHAESSSFYNNGKYFNHAEAELLLFPSKEMRDWSKFAWKKGDVLVSNDGGTEVIFDKWYDDTYTNFYSKHYLNSEDENNIKYNEAFLCTTERYSLEDKDTAQTYINTIEKRLGGKLNLETLVVEKPQPEFKDGDIVYEEGNRNYCSAIGVLKKDEQGCFMFDTFLTRDKVCYNSEYIYLPIRLATEEEKKQLFSALAKEGKAWDAEKKQVVDLKPNVDELKPFEKVLVRDSKSDYWRANLFGYISKDGYYCCVYANWIYCIPYAGNEHLLGTKKITWRARYD